MNDPAGTLKCSVQQSSGGTGWEAKCAALKNVDGINWDAVSAIGTVAAVIVALGLSGAEGRRLKREGRARAIWVKEEFRKPISLWLENARGMLGIINLGQDHNLERSIAKESDHCYPFRIPAQVSDLRGYLHDLGDAGQHVAKAVGLARKLHGCDMLEALRGQFAHREELDIRAEFCGDLESLIKSLESAERALLVDGERITKRRRVRRKHVVVG
ncbi:hypothetical protein RYH75_11255 [Stenotrophomonas geniculata]|uniref:hypothetical protein n=1 Tax=Stenotrophomonas geniculata TaxID=86188 RepID=UPI002949FE46|nr:hypothetical protein [Stenotrophomonas geniculata]MDV6189830.1 hypothetical protein [Stenotrophomonas geniculata]